MRDIQFEWGFWTSFDPAYDWLEDARALQTEIAQDLRGVLTDNSKDLDGSAVDLLVAKINSLNLQPRWTVMWVNPRPMEPKYNWHSLAKRRDRAIRAAYRQFVRSQGKRATAKAVKATMNGYPLYGRKADMEPLLQFLNEALTRFNAIRPDIESHYPRPIYHRPGQPLLKLGPKKFYVTRCNFDGPPRQRLYGVIAEALEDGSFARLRLCKECQKFFLAKNLKQKFCTHECMTAADRKGAAERVRKMRARNKRAAETARKKQMLVEVAAPPKNEPPKRFVEFLNIVSKPKQTEAEERRVLPFLKALGSGEAVAGWQIVRGWERKGNQKPSCQNIWKQLDPHARRIFQE